jgi:hypothetical protein
VSDRKVGMPPALGAPYGSLCGLKVVENPNLVYYEQVKRTWRERLRSKPWRAYKEVAKPDPNFYTSSGTIFAHPATVKSLRHALNAQQGDPYKEFGNARD